MRTRNSLCNKECRRDTVHTNILIMYRMLKLIMTIAWTTQIPRKIITRIQMSS